MPPDFIFRSSLLASDPALSREKDFHFFAQVRRLGLLASCSARFGFFERSEASPIFRRLLLVSLASLVFTIFESVSCAGLGSPRGSRSPTDLRTNLRPVRLSVAVFRIPFSLPSFARPVCVSHRGRRSSLRLFVLLSASSTPAGLGFLPAGLGSAHRIFASPVCSPPSAVFIGAIWFPLADFFLVFVQLRSDPVSLLFLAAAIQSLIVAGEN
jgi:hypothetical protein